ncbi:MAG: dTDP-4-dehydrorhamnose 3,5-epimerase [Bacillota bacterium]
MKFDETEIPEVKLIEPQVYFDSRGFFMESFNEKKWKDAGISLSFVQDNHSRSIKGTLRGLHYQIQHPQGKIVRTILGEVFDVAVDLRRSSRTFGKWVGCILSAENQYQLWIPPGFAHGFYTVSEYAEVIYKATEYYSPENERIIIWNDPHIDILWPQQVESKLILSTKDSHGLAFTEAEVYP